MGTEPEQGRLALHRAHEPEQGFPPPGIGPKEVEVVEEGAGSLERDKVV
jgi:hypothetical protein